MVVDLKKLFQSDNAREKLECSLDLSGVELGGAKPFCAPVKVTAALKSFAGAIDLDAQVEYTLSMPCDRCAETVMRQYTKVFSHTLVRETQEDTDDFVTVPDERLDLEALVLEDLLLDMPGQYLCKEDCKGLCPICGQNWNEGTCRCGAPEVDPRLEALRQFL